MHMNLVTRPIRSIHSLKIEVKKQTFAFLVFLAGAGAGVGTGAGAGVLTAFTFFTFLAGAATSTATGADFFFFCESVEIYSLTDTGTKLNILTYLMVTMLVESLRTDVQRGKF